MEPEQDNRNAPSYLAHYGMHRPPFASKTDDEMYYGEPTRTKRLDILLHLTQYGNELLLVTGPPGSGKTTILQKFLNKAQGNWKVCDVTAHPKMEVDQLLYRICHGFNLSLENAALPIVTNVKRQLEQMLANTQAVVIVIDNAHILSPEVLGVLAEYSKIKNQHTGAHLRIILFAEPQIKIQFASIELENKLKYPVRKIDLPPFDEKQTGELIRHRTKIAGLEADNTFTDAAIGKIYKQSEGIPGNIVELAHRVLFEMTPLKRRTQPATTTGTAATKSKPPVGLIAGVFAVVVISLILMFQGKINNLYRKKDDQSETKERVVSTLAIPQLSAEPGQRNQQQPQLESAANDPLAQQKNLGASSKTIAVFAEDSDSKTQKAQRQPASPRASSVQSGSSQPMPVTKLDNETANNEPLISRINQEAWLLEQDPNAFTVQLVAGYRKSTVNNFLHQYKLPASQMAYYRSLNKGKDWNSLVYGVYPDYRSAMLALDDLPSAVRKGRPWIRQLKSVQVEIKEAGQ